MYLNFLSSETAPAAIEPLPASAAQLHLIAAQLQTIAVQFKPRIINSAWADSRSPLLQALAQALQEKSEQLAQLMSKEAHRPIAVCRIEAKRCVQTVLKTRYALLRAALPQAFDFSDALQGGHNGTSQRFTFAPLFAITPFNFPLNLTLHKIAPALALGIPFVCKAPLINLESFQLLHDILLSVGIPEKEFAFLFVRNEHISPLLDELSFPLLSFTGSRTVGMELKKRYWDRRVILELGSTSAALVCDDVPKWTLEKTMGDLARSAFGNSGQSCLSLQHLVVDDEVFTDSVALFKDASLKIAEHRARTLETTLCSEMVDANAFAKVASLVEDARSKGCEIWQAGEHNLQQNYFAPTLVMAKKDAAHPLVMKLFAEEAFGPVVCVHRVPRNTPVEKIMALVNSFDANLHASVFTYSSQKLRQYYEGLSARTVLWNEIPSWRSDEMPYGGCLFGGSSILAAGASAPTGAGGVSRASSGLAGNEGPFQTLCEYTIDRLLILP